LARSFLRYQNNETHENMSKLSDINKEAHDGFQQSFKINKIYLPKQTAKQTVAYLATVSQLISKSSLIAHLSPIAKANNLDTLINELKSEVAELEKSISVLLETLEDDFQRILGFSMTDKEKTA
jgi:hypothetical protein